MDFIQTALDTTIDGRYVDLTILLSDKDGQMPEYVCSGRGSEEDSGAGEESQRGKGKQEGEKKKLGKVLYRKIAQSDFEVHYYYFVCTFSRNAHSLAGLEEPRVLCHSHNNDLD